VSDDKLTPIDHVASPGEHLSRVAAIYRFRSYGPLWNDPRNRELRSKRPNPHQLAAGDWVHVPELNYQEVDRSTEARHRFRAEVHPLELRLVLRHWDGRPRSDPEDVLLDGRSTLFQILKPGAIAVPLTPRSDRCLVKTGGEEILMRVGFLEPVETIAGVHGRLANLGYQPGESSDPTKLDFRSAVEEFQCDHGLVVDGKVGPVTRAKLLAVHGS
jgi:hypothetical protein